MASTRALQRCRGTCTHGLCSYGLNSYGLDESSPTVPWHAADARLYACLHTCLHTCPHACLCTCPRTCLNTCQLACLYACLCTCLRTPCHVAGLLNHCGQNGRWCVQRNFASSQHWLTAPLRTGPSHNYIGHNYIPQLPGMSDNHIGHNYITAPARHWP